MIATPIDPDEQLSTRLRDLALVDFEGLTGGYVQPALVDAYADDVVDALGEVRQRMASLRAALGGGDVLALLDASVGQRAADPGPAVTRMLARLAAQAEAARALGRFAELTATLVPKLFEADRRRSLRPPEAT